MMSMTSCQRRVLTAAVAAACLLSLANAAGIVILDHPNTPATHHTENHAHASHLEEELRNAGSNMRFADAAVSGTGKGYVPTCDLVAMSGICLFNGQKVLLPDATEKGLVAWYKFDESHPVDSSRQQNHGDTGLPVGPSRDGSGASAFFDGDVWLHVPESDTLKSAASRSTTSFWVYLRPDIDNTFDRFCPIVSLGSADAAAAQITYNPRTKQFGAAAAKGTAQVKSIAKPRSSSWHHIAFVVGKDTVTLFIDGVPDATAAVPQQELEYSGFELHAGRIPWSDQIECHIPLYIDDLRVYSRALTAADIGAASFPALGVTEAAAVRLGNSALTFAEADQVCGQQYHLCYEAELQAGAYGAAYKLGWVDHTTKIWTPESRPQTDEQKEKMANEKRLALCCQ